jgi:hypothetical protein
MKPFVIYCVLAFAGAMCMPSGASAHKTVHVKQDCQNDNLFRDDNINLDIEDKAIVFTHSDDDETVKITEDGGLVVNGNPVPLALDQRKLVADYYEALDGVLDEAKHIGLEGAKIGVRGAAFGLSAVVGALLSISNGRDSDNVEAELDRKGERIERMAERLERRAERLEVRAERLRGMHENLRSRIGELGDLGWF